LLDTTTLRVAFTAVAFTVAVLLAITLGRVRSTYATWWCLSLLLFMAGDALFLSDGTSWQAVSNPIGDTTVVAGAAAAWGGARSLRAGCPPLWQLLLGPIAAGAAAAVDHPGDNEWAGGPVFLSAMVAYFALGCYDTAVVSRPSASRRSADRVYEALTAALSVAFGALGVFYVGRLVALFVWGTSSTQFQDWFGSGPATLVQLVLLVIVAFTMSSLMSEQKVRELQVRASRDSLTGLLNRAEFLHRAQEALLAAHRNGVNCAVVMADLDLFKSVNDRFGHATGDRVLRSFARACTAALRPGDLVGRYGGEEFVLFLADAMPSEAEKITRDITRRFQAMTSLPDYVPTASYGIAPFEAGVKLDRLIERADVALYRAKAAGRDRAAHYRA